MRTAIATRGLLLWCVAVSLCSLLDEILVAFAALHLRDSLGAGVHERNVAVGAWMVGNVTGMLLVERLVSVVAPVRLLVGLAAAGTACNGTWLLAWSVASASVSLFLVGLTTAGLYPIAKAQAYATLPERSGAVNAVKSLFIPLAVVTPLLLGWMADRLGLLATLAVLAAQPLGLLLIGVVWLRRHSI